MTFMYVDIVDIADIVDIVDTAEREQKRCNASQHSTVSTPGREHPVPGDVLCLDCRLVYDWSQHREFLLFAVMESVSGQIRW